MMVLKLFFVATIFAIELSAANTLKFSREINSQIVGGELIEIEKVPWQVSLQSGCGGAIISNKWVLTAAQCDSNITK